MKEERASQLQKEIYFNSQKQAEYIWEAICKNRTYIDEYNFVLEKPDEFPIRRELSRKKFSEEAIDKHFGDKKEKFVRKIAIYFPDLIKPYGAYCDSIFEVNRSFFELLKLGQDIDEKEQAIKAIKAIAHFRKVDGNLVIKLSKELENIKSKII